MGVRLPLAAASDLKLFFAEVGKSPEAVTTAAVLGFIAAERRPVRRRMVRPADGAARLALSTIKRVWCQCRACSAIW